MLGNKQQNRSIGDRIDEIVLACKDQRCSFKTTRQANLDGHLYFKHKNLLDENEIEVLLEKYVCKYCKLQTIGYLRRHLLFECSSSGSVKDVGDELLEDPDDEEDDEDLNEETDNLIEELDLKKFDEDTENAQFNEFNDKSFSSDEFEEADEENNF